VNSPHPTRSNNSSSGQNFEVLIGSYLSNQTSAYLLELKDYNCSSGEFSLPPPQIVSVRVSNYGMGPDGEQLILQLQIITIIIIILGFRVKSNGSISCHVDYDVHPNGGARLFTLRFAFAKTANMGCWALWDGK
jgi:hypothetical protein